MIYLLAIPVLWILCGSLTALIAIISRNSFLGSPYTGSDGAVILAAAILGPPLMIQCIKALLG
jgi:hypothetical protein